MQEVTLVEMEPGATGTITSISGGTDLQAKLASLGLRPGKQVTKVSSVFSGGPVALSVDGFQVAIGWGKATRVMVRVDPS